LGLRGTREQKSEENYITKSLMICTPHPIFFGRSNRVNEMGRVCETYGGGQLYSGFWWENLRERGHLEDPCVDGGIILSWIFSVNPLAYYFL